MLQLLLDNPLLLLFLVSAIGYAVGRITIAGTSLGVAAVLFVGLAVRRAASRPEAARRCCTSLASCCLSTPSGSPAAGSFSTPWAARGCATTCSSSGCCVAATGLTLALGRLLGCSPGLTAGMFAGSLTNTAALAAVLEVGCPHRAGRAARPAARRAGGRLLADLSDGRGRRRLWRSCSCARSGGRLAAGGDALEALGISQRPLLNRTIRVTRPDVTATPMAADRRRAAVERHARSDPA